MSVKDGRDAFLNRPGQCGQQTLADREYPAAKLAASAIKRGEALAAAKHANNAQARTQLKRFADKKAQTNKRREHAARLQAALRAIGLGH